MNEEKHAFIVPNTHRVVPIVDGEASRGQISKVAARAEGYRLHSWPEDEVGLRVDVNDLPEYVPAPAAATDPAIAALVERGKAILSSPEGQAQPDAAILLIGESMPIDQARAFLRGLPTTEQIQIQLQTEAKGTTEMKPYANQPAGREARALEIRLGGLSARASNGDFAAKKKMQIVQAARFTAESTGQPLHAVLTAMRADI